MTSLFLQFHTLTGYPGALLNRDDAGFAKRLPFGGAVRTRISSQCLKRHWRVYEGDWSLASLGVPGSIRSRLTFEREILAPLLKEGVHEDVARAVVDAVIVEVLGQSAKSKAKAKEEAEGAPAGDAARSGKVPDEEGDAKDGPRTGQITVLGRREVDWLLGEARAVCTSLSTSKDAGKAVKARLGKQRAKNIDSLRKASAGLDAAMFGRMVTGDILSRGDAAVHVAHAFTVHEESSESDYFSAVDDLLREPDSDEAGSGHIGASELTSGLFYGYVVVDVPTLVANLEGVDPRRWMDADRSLAGRVVENLVHLISTVSPGAKLGSTAPYAYSSLVLAEAGTAQPRTLANAFVRPIDERPDVIENACAALGDHIRRTDAAYELRWTRRLAHTHPAGDRLAEQAAAGSAMSVPTLSAWAREMVVVGA